MAAVTFDGSHPAQARGESGGSHEGAAHASQILHIDFHTPLFRSGAEQDRVADPLASLNSDARVALLFSETEHIQVRQRLVDDDRLESADAVHCYFFATAQISGHRLFDVMQFGSCIAAESFQSL